MPAPRHRTTGSCLHLSLSSAGRIGKSLQSKEKGAKMKEEERREEEEERGQEEDDVVDLFLSTADLKRQAASPRPQTAEGRRVGRAGFHGDETEGTRRRHEEIVRKILEEFDLEATKKKYRSFDAVEMQITGSSSAEYRFRQELMRLMGTETIRLNDREWNRKYHERLRQDYERALIEKERQLAEKERERIHRLRMEGIVLDKASAADREKKKMKTLKSQRQLTFSFPVDRKCSSDRPSEQAHTEAQTQVPSVVVDEGERTCKPLTAKKKGQKKERPKQGPKVTKEASRATSYVPKMLTPADLTNLLASTRAELNPGASKMGEPVSQETIFLSREEHKMQSRELMRQKRAKQGLTRIVLPEIAELYQEETIAGLYAIAKQIVCVFHQPP
ncbi:eukaryotic translation initiation factor 5B-like isoform X2 [Pomacea canaliculata]|uniref:eukaryotic translation initiation factor 5B-like isoform X2 n=1 Tax=Pomacea canaliculata TaxID=400727 RepID=UPI000D72A22B|nr:eukaryotic translation initiation factor 5B-like isoform X2 [Pomacea canaliculata]